MASINLDNAAANAFLKELYTAENISDLTYAEKPFMALVKKVPGLQGTGEKVPLQISNSSAFSVTLAQAQATLAAADFEAFLVTPITLLAVGRIAGITVQSSSTSRASFAKGVKVVVDNALKRLAAGVSSGLFRDGSGILSNIAVISSGVITLANPEDTVQFEVNQALQAVAYNGTSPRATVGYVIAVDRVGGTITVSTSLGGAAGSPSGWTAGNGSTTWDGLCTYGTYGLQISGLQKWLSNSSTPGTLFGVDRNKDVTRLAGVYFDGSQYSVKDALIQAVNLVAREGGRPDYALMNFESYTQLLLDLQSNVIYVNLQAEGQISFSGVKVMGPKGAITVLPDRDCPAKTCFLLQLDTWMAMHVNESGPLCFLEENNVGSVLRTTESYDGYEVRAKAYCNLVCTAPGFNARILLSA